MMFLECLVMNIFVEYPYWDWNLSLIYKRLNYKLSQAKKKGRIRLFAFVSEWQENAPVNEELRKTLDQLSSLIMMFLECKVMEIETYH